MRRSPLRLLSTLFIANLFLQAPYRPPWRWEENPLHAGRYRALFDGNNATSCESKASRLLTMSPAIESVRIDSKSHYVYFVVKKHAITRAQALEQLLDADQKASDPPCRLRHLRKKEWGGWF